MDQNKKIQTLRRIIRMQSALLVHIKIVSIRENLVLREKNIALREEIIRLRERILNLQTQLELTQRDYRFLPPLPIEHPEFPVLETYIFTPRYDANPKETSPR